MRKLPPIEQLTTALEYRAGTGEILFKPRTSARACWNARHAGKRALSTKGADGYLRGYLFSEMTLAHRVAFALHVGRSDIGFIDHINGNRSDNRACNLREVSRSENARNKARPSNSTTGYIGVSRTHDGKFRAHITINNKTKHLGRFDSLIDAIVARKSAERKFGFHLNHGRDLFIEGAAA